MGERNVNDRNDHNDEVDTLTQQISNELEAAKHYWQHNHMQSPRVMREGEGQDHRYQLAKFIQSLALPIDGDGDLNTISVFEFGCASGRNLAILREYLPHAKLVGIDQCKTTLNRGRETHPSIVFLHGDESALQSVADNAYTVAFTSSVLDHIPHPYWREVYDHLVRVSKIGVLLHEPIINLDDDVEVDFLDTDIATTPFTYSHPYLLNDKKLTYLVDLPIEQTPSFQPFGNLYRLMWRVKT